MSKVLNLRNAERFVKTNKDVRWEGWDMVFFREDPSGYSNVNGAFSGGKWGMQTRVSVSENGTWVVPSRVAKRFKNLEG